MAIVAISSWVMRGVVGLRATAFALERRGATVWAVPTVLLPWHPGLGRSTRTVPAEFAVQLAEMAAHAAHVDAVVTGYFASPDQVEAAAQFIDRVRAVRPDALVVVDPVMGDEAGRYVPDAVAEAIAGALIPRADVATPNRHELADLTDGLGGIEAARALGPATVITTSAVEEAGRSGALLVRGSDAVYAAHDVVEPAPRGTGDLFLGVAVSALVAGLPARQALHHAAAATYGVVARSGGESLALTAAQEAIASPPLAAVTLHDVGAGRTEPSANGVWRTAPTVYGVDGCPGGWAVVEISAEGEPCPSLRFETDLSALIGRAALAIDIPIGLPERIEGPGRKAEQTIRPLLGARAPSVFSMQSRAAIHATGWDEACALAQATSTPAKKPSKQGFMIYPKIRELDAILSPANQESVFETHAEMAFWRLNGEAPMATGKAVRGVGTREALASRIALLVAHGFEAAFFDGPRPRGVPLVDVVDAAAIALIARRCRDGTAQPFPDPPEVDGRGLRAAIWA